MTTRTDETIGASNMTQPPTWLDLCESSCEADLSSSAARSLDVRQNILETVPRPPAQSFKISQPIEHTGGKVLLAREPVPSASAFIKAKAAPDLPNPPAFALAASAPAPIDDYAEPSGKPLSGALSVSKAASRPAWREDDLTGEQDRRDHRLYIAVDLRLMRVILGLLVFALVCTVLGLVFKT